MRSLFIALLFIGTLSALAQKTETLTNASVINLHKAGLDDALIITKIESSACKFDVSADGLIALKKADLSKEVIKAMLDKSLGKASANAETNAPKPGPKTTTSATNKKVPVPEFVNQIVFYDKPAGKLSNLEKSKAGQKTKAKALGYGGYSMNLEVAGEASTVKLSPLDTHSFVVSFAEGMGEPSAWFTLYKAEIKKGKRTAVWMQGNGVGQTSSGDGVILFNTKNVGERLFELVP